MTDDLTKLELLAKGVISSGLWYAWRHRVCRVGTPSDQAILTYWAVDVNKPAESLDAKFVAAANPDVILKLIERVRRGICCSEARCTR